MEAAQHFLAPFVQNERSFETLGDLLVDLRTRGPGRYPTTNSKGETFSIIVYDDGSWRATSAQLDLFTNPHTLT